MLNPGPRELIDSPALEFMPHSRLEILRPAGGQQGNGATLEALSETASLLPRERPDNRISQEPPFDASDGDARGAAVPLVVVQLENVRAASSAPHRYPSCIGGL